MIIIQSNKTRKITNFPVTLLILSLKQKSKNKNAKIIKILKTKDINYNSIPHNHI
jgi:hypothetical protein